MRRSLILVVTLTVATMTKAQGQPWSWKEYVYADDGFAVTLPLAPVPHNDPNSENITVYTVNFDRDSRFSLRVVHQRKDCAATLSELKEGALKNKQPNQPINSASVRDVSLDGNPGLEYEFKAGSTVATYNRFLCVEGHFYIFSVSWPSCQTRPAAADRIMKSFRVLNAGARNFAPVSLAGKKPDTGSVSGHVYRNEFFRFTYSLPEDFNPSPLPPEALAQFDRMNSFFLLFAGSDQPSSTSAAMPSALEVSAWSEPSLWGSEWIGKTGGDYLTRLRTMLKKLEPTGPVRQRTIEGLTFYEADAQSSPTPEPRRKFEKTVVMTTDTGYILQFVFSANTLEELGRLDRSIYSIRFDSQ